MNKKRLYSRASSEQQYEPRIFKEIMNEVILNSEMPFYSELRQRQATAYPNTEPGVDLKLMTRQPGRIPIGEARNGILMRDGDDHFCFVEKTASRETSEQRKRKEPLFSGTCINVRIWDDGSMHVAIKRPQCNSRLDLAKFCIKAADELTTVAEVCLGEK